MTEETRPETLQGCTVRAMTPNDIGPAGRLYFLAASQDTERGIVSSDQVLGHLVEQLLDVNPPIFLLAEHEGKLVGLIIAKFEFGEVSGVQVIVHPEWWNMGIASILIDSANIELIPARAEIFEIEYAIIGLEEPPPNITIHRRVP